MIRAKGEIIKFTTRDGLVLEGFLMPSTKCGMCVIHVHGMTSNFYRGNLPFAMAPSLNKRGVSLFSINTRGHDITASMVMTSSRLRKSRTKYLALGTSLEKFEDCIFDIDGAIKALHKLGFKSFILSGHSTGCQKITYYQYKRNRGNIKGLILLAPSDDYNHRRKELGRRFNKVVNKCKRLVRLKKGDSFDKTTFPLSAKRFLSVADLKNVEAMLFNYSGPLKEICNIKVPVLAIFGSRDELATEPVRKYLETLMGKREGKPSFYAIINGARHSFRNHEDDVSDAVSKWISEQSGKA